MGPYSEALSYLNPYIPVTCCKTLERGCRMVYAGFPSFVGIGLEDGHVAQFSGFYCHIAASSSEVKGLLMQVEAGRAPTDYPKTFKRVMHEPWCTF